MANLLPPRFCEICGAVHEPPIHDARCYPGRLCGRIYFSPLDPDAPMLTKEEIQEGIAYWDAVFTDKGTKPVS